ncbi:hypothetical protein ATN79_20570 [Paraburkholderia caribensis]|nr:hypothetical protein ATN79_20570 [Paraburkholderia caribensis]
MTLLQDTLKEVQLRLSVVHRKRLTHNDLASIAEVNPRALGEWMRGTTAPAGMSALLRLLSQLPSEQIEDVLLPWRNAEMEPVVGTAGMSRSTTAHR